MGREEFSRTSVARYAEPTCLEILLRERGGTLVAVGIAGHLAEDPVTSACAGQDDRRPKLLLGEIRERERDKFTDPLQGMTTRHPPRDDSNPRPAIARSAGKSRGFAPLVLRQGWSPGPAGNEATATARKAAPDRARQQPL